MRILALLHRAAEIIYRVKDLTREAFAHGLLVAGAGIPGNPAQAERLTALGADFHRHLVGSAADTAGLYLKARHDIFHCLVEHFERIAPGLLTDNIESTIYDLLRHTLLAVKHDRVDQLGDKLGIVKRVGQNVSLRNVSSSWHFTSLLH